MLHISLFSGIGGFDLASEWMGWKNIVSCEINPFCNSVLKHYWPDAYHHNDIKTLTYEKINKELNKRFGIRWRTDDIVLTGGFPCQPYSVAGKRLGKDDERHLWPEMLRTIREIQPKWIVGENVLGLLSWNDGMVFEEVQSQLEAEGYKVQAFILPACSVNAPHRRDRIWFVAYSTNSRCRRWKNKQCKSREWSFLSGKSEGRKMGNKTSRCYRKQFTSNPNYHGFSSSKIRHSLGKGNNCNKTREIYGEQPKRCSIQNARNATHTSCQQGEWLQSKQRKFSQSEQRKFRGSNCPVSPTNTMRRRQSSQKYRKAKSRFFAEKSFSSDWENFPVESPICSRDDGISSELDRDAVFEGIKINAKSIAFNRWRNESIKAFGNAVVPQIVYQIFRAIQEFETQNRFSN